MVFPPRRDPTSPRAAPPKLQALGLFHSVRGSRHSTNAQVEMKTLADRFFAKVLKGSSCWAWNGSNNGKGYGQLRVGSTMRRAHRISYELHCGEIPDGLLVCHHCDNPSCVNPEHLFLGSQADNIADMRSKGRGGHMTKLSQADVLAIRATTGVTQRLLAEEYGVTQQQISNIKRFGAVLLSQTPAAGA